MPKPLLRPPPSAEPVSELTDSGLYVRFGASRRVARTLICQEWPLLAVDLDADGRAIGLEAIPAPTLSLRKLARRAGILLT